MRYCAPSAPSSPLSPAPPAIRPRQPEGATTAGAGAGSSLLTGCVTTAIALVGVEVGALVTGASATSALGFPLLLIVAFVSGRNRAAYQRQAEQSAALVTQMEQLRAEQRRAAVLDERTRIAREIHDVLGGMLTGLKMDVAQLRRNGGKLEPQALEKLDTFSQAIDQAVQAVRRIASDLRPAILDDFGLVAALEWQLGEFERRSGLDCHWVCSVDELELPAETATDSTAPVCPRN